MAKNKITIDALAAMVQQGFNEVATKNDLSRIETQLEKMDGKLDEMDTRLYSVERAVFEQKKHFTQRFEFDDLAYRVSSLEKRTAAKKK